MCLNDSCWCFGHMAFCHKLSLMSESSILMFNTVALHKQWHMGAIVPSGRISNNTLTCSISFTTVSVQNVLIFMASRARSYSSVLGSSIPILWILFKYLVCHFLTETTILSCFLRTYLTHQLKACSYSIPCVTANLAVCTGCYSSRSDRFSHDVNLFFHRQQIF